MPVWRDTECLLTLLDSPEPRAAAETIVACVDDEQDEIAALAPPGVRLVTARPGRASQMNAGAEAASGEWLLFLHADSTLPASWLQEIAAADRDPQIVAGAFRFALDSRDVRARLVEWAVGRRTRWFGLPYGDQGLFVRRSVFEALGGYREIPLMEDVDFVRRVRRKGRLHHADRPLVTSARRWHKAGWLRGVLTNWVLVTAFSAGVSPRRLMRVYSHRRHEAVAVIGRDPRSVGKSRLWEALAIPPDPELMIALLSDTMASVDRVPAVDKLFVHTGSRRAVAEFCSDGWTTLGQRGADLGQRMSHAFDDLFALGYSRVALIGSDLPSLPTEHIGAALHHLQDGADVVLGPSEDGGFYLVGLRSPQPTLFADVTWTTDHVFRDVCNRARSLRLELRLVEPWYDVDDPPTLRRAAEASAPRTQAWARGRSLAP